MKHLAPLNLSQDQLVDNVLEDMTGCCLLGQAEEINSEFSIFFSISERNTLGRKDVRPPAPPPPQTLRANLSAWVFEEYC